MAAAARIGTHIRGTAETGDATLGRGRRIALQIDLQGRPDEHVAGIVAGGLAQRAVAAHAAVGSDGKHVGTRTDIVFHPQLGAERIDRLDKARFDGWDQGGVGVERPVARDLAFQAQRLRVGRQQQFDGGGVEADTVIEAVDFILGIDALDRHHRHQHLDLGDLRRVAREQRFDIVGLRRLHDKVDPVAGNVHTRQHVDNPVDLGDHDTVLESGRFDDGRRVFGIGSGVQVAMAVGRFGGDQCHARRQVDEIAAE